jgi:hypothetical protein
MAAMELGPAIHGGHGRVLRERAPGSEVEGGGELRDKGGATVGSSSSPQRLSQTEAHGEVEDARHPWWRRAVHGHHALVHASSLEQKREQVAGSEVDHLELQFGPDLGRSRSWT